MHNILKQFVKLFWATTSHGLKGPIKTNGQIMDKGGITIIHSRAYIYFVII